MPVFMVKMFIKTTGSEQEVRINSGEQHINTRDFLVFFVEIKNNMALLLSGVHNLWAFKIVF